MSNRADAERLFRQIGTGAHNAVKRPANSHTDRIFRQLIEEANISGDCIISGKNGYYRPRPYIPEENMEYNKYDRQGLSRGRAILYKRRKMREAYNRTY